MPRFMIERNFAEQVEANRDVVSAITQVNADVGVQWLFSFLSADKKKTHCLYEAPNAEAIREAARRLNIPADEIIEFSDELRPEALMQQRGAPPGRACPVHGPWLAPPCSSSRAFSPVAGLIARQEHGGVLVLRVRQPGPRLHAGVHGQSILEVLRCFVPALQSGG